MNPQTVYGAIQALLLGVVGGAVMGLAAFYLILGPSLRAMLDEVLGEEKR